MNWVNTIQNVVSILFVVLILVGVLHRLWRDRWRRPRRAKGKLVDKFPPGAPQSSLFGSLWPSQPSQSRFRFEIQGRVREFDGDALLYDRLEVGQEGTLTYRGRRLIDFDE